MTLPFTVEQFLDVFAAYNRALWPGALLLWVATLLAIVMLVRNDPRSSRLVGGLLAIHWAWSGVAYHLAFFRDIIRPRCCSACSSWGRRHSLPGGHHELRRRPSVFEAGIWSRLGLAPMAYAIAYPALSLALGLSYPRMPTFGVPCPTTIFTVGALPWRGSRRHGAWDSFHWPGQW